MTLIMVTLKACCVPSGLPSESNRRVAADLNKSGSAFRVERCEKETLALRYALGAIRNVSAEAMEKFTGKRVFARFNLSKISPDAAEGNL